MNTAFLLMTQYNGQAIIPLAPRTFPKSVGGRFYDGGEL